jgi:alpha-glucosidase
MLTIAGTFIPLDEKNEKTYSYIRHDKTIDQKILVILNFSRSGPDAEGYYHGEKASFEVPSDIDVSNARLIITNGGEKEGSGLEGSKIELSEWEGRVYVL